MSRKFSDRLTFTFKISFLAKAPVKVSFYKTDATEKSSLDDAIQKTAKYPNTPDWIGFSDTFVFNDWNDYYMLRFQANFLAPETGQYTFYVSCDNYAKLYLSTDKSQGNKQEIAHVTAWSQEWNWSKLVVEYTLFYLLKALFVHIFDYLLTQPFETEETLIFFLLHAALFPFLLLSFAVSI